MDFLKEILGDELYGQVETKLAGSKVKLADLSGGAYVSKEKHDAACEQLRLAQEALKGFGGKTVEQINTEIADWKQKAETAEQDANAKISAMEFDAALNSALGSARARNPKAVAALLNRDALKMSDGTIIGLKEQLDTIRKDNAYMFEPEQSGGAGFAGKQSPNVAAGTSEAMNTILRGETNG